jgi:hypothetical protein
MRLFELGQVVATPGAIELFEKHNIDPLDLLYRHLTGDWGELDEHDILENKRAIRYGYRVLSSYKFGEDTIWLITEADRSVSTFLEPSEY